MIVDLEEESYPQTYPQFDKKVEKQKFARGYLKKVKSLI